MEKKRENWLDTAKGIAIIFVVLGHIFTSYNNSGYKDEVQILEWVYNIAYGFHMPLFFVIAGTLAGKARAKDSVGKQITKKAIAYGIPYIAFSVADFLFKSLAGAITNSTMTMKDLLMIPVVPIGPLWYLYALMIVSIVHILLRKRFGENRKVFYVALAVSGICHIIISLLMKKDGFEDTFISQTIIMDLPRGYMWYLCGTFWGKVVSEKAKNISGPCATLSILVLTVLWGVIVNLEIDSVFAQLVFSIIGVVIAIYYAVKLPENKILLHLGKNTLPIYLLHGYFIAAIRVFLTKLSIPVVSGVTPLFVCGILATIAPLLVYFVIVKNVSAFDFWLYPGKYLNKKKTEVQ